MPAAASALLGLLLLSPYAPSSSTTPSVVGSASAVVPHWGAYDTTRHALRVATGPASPDDSAPQGSPEPDAGDPDAAKPDAGDPDGAQPDAAAPDSAGPDTPGPDSAGPDTPGPDTPTAADGAAGDASAATEPGQGSTEPATAGDAAGPSTTGTTDADAKPKDGEDNAPDEMSLDDIFGTADTHTDVDVVSESPEGAGEGDGPAKPKTATPAARRSVTDRVKSKLDTRVRVVSSVYYDTARVQQRGFGRNENRLEFYFAYTPNEHLQIVGDVEPVFFGVAQTQALDDLATRQMLTPFHVESDAAYIALNDVLPNLDIKIGRQTVVWGTADKFNPTNNINADDLEDRPLFTEPIGNQMVVVDYAPLADKLWFQGVYVPIFYPALLPPSAAEALKDPQTEVPFANASDEVKIGELQRLLDITPMLVPDVIDNVKTPRARFANGQSAIKLGTSLGGVDMSVSYYNGRHDIPTPILAESTTKEFEEGADVAGCCFESRITLIYPRMQVIGFDFTTQLPFLRNMGLWGEGGLFIPQAHDLRIEFPINVDVTPDDGTANPVSELVGPTVRATPYIKATAGLDYSFGKHVYVQAQYLRGFIDEFGADHIGNYLVGGTDLIFFGRHLIFRAFGVADLPTGRGDPGSFVVYPELIVVPPWGSVTLELGSFFLIGPERTKFGQRAAGSSIAFFKVAGTF